MNPYVTPRDDRSPKVVRHGVALRQHLCVFGCFLFMTIAWCLSMRTISGQRKTIKARESIQRSHERFINHLLKESYERKP